MNKDFKIIKRDKHSNVSLEWMEDEMEYLVVGPVSVMSGHLPTIDLNLVTARDLQDLAWCLEELAALRQKWSQHAIYKKEWNCECKQPQPDGKFEVGEFEGRYERCLGCDGRIWT